MFNTALSANARLLHLLMMGLSTRLDISNAYLVKVLGISPAALGRAKTELTKADLLYIRRVGPKSFEAYVGNSNITAKALYLRKPKDEVFE